MDREKILNEYEKNRDKAIPLSKVVFPLWAWDALKAPCSGEPLPKVFKHKSVV